MQNANWNDTCLHTSFPLLLESPDMTVKPFSHDPILEELLDLQPGKIELGFERLNRVLDFLVPHPQCRTILIGGTNGKGSTVAFLECLLRSRGRTIGSYTSPHLHRVQERFRIQGTPVEESRLRKGIEEVRSAVENLKAPLTFFEFLTVCAVVLFERSNVEFTLLEVGLGGRLDATNAVEPELSILTSVGMDHMEWLGDTLEQIAWEKGGIIRGDKPLITGFPETALQAALKGRAVPQPLLRLGAEIQRKPMNNGGMQIALGDDVWDIPVVGLVGEHQQENAALALAAALQLIPEGWTQKIVQEGLSQAQHPGRFETIHEGGVEWVLDGAHNPEGAKCLVQALCSAKKVSTTVWIVAVKEPRVPESLIRLWYELGDYWIPVSWTEHPMVPLSRWKQAFPEEAEKVLPMELGPDVIDAAREAAGEGGRVVVAGSLYLIGAIRTMLGRFN